MVVGKTHFPGCGRTDGTAFRVRPASSDPVDAIIRTISVDFPDPFCEDTRAEDNCP